MSTYTIIYNRLKNIRCTPVELDEVKLLFMDEINSKRRYHAIGSLLELLRVLEKRNCLNPDNLEPLERIAAVLRPSVLNISYPQAPINNSLIQGVVEYPGIPEMLSDPKTRAYRLIAIDIGKKWADFARAVGLREGEIDYLSRDVTTVSERVYKILRFHEENCDRRKWLSSLLHALREARRSDLCTKVQNIFDTS